MRILAVSAVVLIAGIEIFALTLLPPRFVPAASGIVTALLLFVARGLLTGRRTRPAPDRHVSNDAVDLLRQWMSSAEMQIRWAESSRADWDRRWRPVLARRFEISTGQRHGKDAATFIATGRMLLGNLWEWVDPDNVVRSEERNREPGPGRVVLEEILRRLEQQ